MLLQGLHRPKGGETNRAKSRKHVSHNPMILSSRQHILQSPRLGTKFSDSRPQEASPGRMSRRRIRISAQKYRTPTTREEKQAVSNQKTCVFALLSAVPDWLIIFPLLYLQVVLLSSYTEVMIGLGEDNDLMISWEILWMQQLTLQDDWTSSFSQSTSSNSTWNNV